MRSAGLLGQKFAFQVSFGVTGQWHAGKSPLLRAVVYEAVFTDVEIARASAATPVIGLGIGNGFLKLIELRIIFLLPAAHLIPHAALFAAQRLQLAVAVVNNTNRRSKAQSNGASADRQRI